MGDVPDGRERRVEGEPDDGSLAQRLCHARGPPSHEQRRHRDTQQRARHQLVRARLQGYGCVQDGSTVATSRLGQRDGRAPISTACFQTRRTSRAGRTRRPVPPRCLRSRAHSRTLFASSTCSSEMPIDMSGPPQTRTCSNSQRKMISPPGPRARRSAGRRRRRIRGSRAISPPQVGPHHERGKESDRHAGRGVVRR